MPFLTLNGIELYYDWPRDEWFDAQGNPNFKAEPFEPTDLLRKGGGPCE